MGRTQSDELADTCSNGRLSSVGAPEYGDHRALEVFSDPRYCNRRGPTKSRTFALATDSARITQLPRFGSVLRASFHLVTGAMPYRDFTFVQPPGILLLMSPVTLISRLIGTHDGFILARVVDALVTALNASLLAWLIRHRGRTAMVVAGAGLALMPVAAFVSSGVRLEPFLVCFILLGSLAVFSRNEDRDASTRQLVVCGLLFGAAALVKLWALFSVHRIDCLLGASLSPSHLHCHRRGGGWIHRCLPALLFVSTEKFHLAGFRRANKSQSQYGQQ